MHAQVGHSMAVPLEAGQQLQEPALAVQGSHSLLGGWAAHVTSPQLTGERH